jgi:hypothetical protein
MFHKRRMISSPGEDQFSNQPEPPSLPEETWEELYSLSAWPLKNKPWERMHDYHAIVIVDPDTGDRQLAIVMGNAKTLFAIHIYQPEEGTRWYSNLQLHGGSPLASHCAQFDNRYLEVEFSDGSELTPYDEHLDDAFAPDDWFDEEDPEAIDCVSFRAVIPGCPPWHPDLGEAKRMADALRLVRRYYEEYFDKYEWASFTLDEEKHSVSLPTFTLAKGARREDAKAWTFGMELFKAPGLKTVPEVLPDELFVARLADLKVKPGTTWEIGSVFSPKPMVDGERPVYPVFGVVAVQETGRAEGTEVLSSLEPRERIIRNSLTTAAQNVGYLPSNIGVGSPIAELGLADLAAARGITITPEGTTALFNDMVQDLLQSPLFANDEILDEDSPLSQISPEEITRIDNLMRNSPGADADPKELAAFMEELMSTASGQTVMKTFLEQDGGSNFLEEAPASLARPPYQAPKSRQRCQFRVDLVGAKPPLWRRLSVPEDATFFDLHLAIQAAFGWSGHNLHAFEKRIYGECELVIDWHGKDDSMLGRHHCARETEVQVGYFFEHNDVPSLNYVYDFRNNWDHKIKFEKTITAEGSDDIPLVEVLKGKGASPLEDCGGIHGFMALLRGDHPGMADLPPERLAEIQAGLFVPEEIHLRDPSAEIELMNEMNHN